MSLSVGAFPQRLRQFFAARMVAMDQSMATMNGWEPVGSDF
jgi:hypothetical protein